MKDWFWCARQTVGRHGAQFWLSTSLSYTRGEAWEILLDIIYGKMNPDEFQKKRREARRQGYEVIKVRLQPLHRVSE